MIGRGLCALITEALKNRVGKLSRNTYYTTTTNRRYKGRLRPDFLDRCKWDKALKACAGYAYVLFPAVGILTSTLQKGRVNLGRPPLLSFWSLFYGLRRHDFSFAVDCRDYWSVVFDTACTWRVAPAQQARKADSIASPARVRNVGRRIPSGRLRESIVNSVYSSSH